MSETELSAAPPGFLRLAGHPVRWRLLGELAHSDRRVTELCSALDMPQNLVSYHLARLRSEHVVTRRRSTADGRDSYYLLDLECCRELLAATGAALHPGLRLVPPAARLPARRVRALFLCTGNSARSQIAQALIGQLGGGAVEARSAGSHPKPLHPNAIRVARERGLATDGWRSKHLDELTGDRFEYVISLCDRVLEVCPEFPGHPDVIHWSVPDPSRAVDSDKETYPAFRRTAEELATRIAFLLERIAHDTKLRG